MFVKHSRIRSVLTKPCIYHIKSNSRLLSRPKFEAVLNFGNIFNSYINNKCVVCIKWIFKNMLIVVSKF